MTTTHPIRRGRGRAKATVNLIGQIRSILEQIQPCSVRAVAYQLFNRKLIPSMNTQNVAKVSRLLVIAREDGTIPWEWIVDPSRESEAVATWADPPAFARDVQASYRRNKWDDQPKHMIVLSEKGTVAGTLRPILDEYEVPFQVLHGWSGATPIHDLAQANLARHQDTIVLYVGDFDPSGMYMSERDLRHRIARYSSDAPDNRNVSDEWAVQALRDVRLEIRRIALTEADTDSLGPATSFNAAEKRNDPRYAWFVSQYGDRCWELDAMSPAVLRGRVKAAIVGELDLESWERYVAVENLEREVIAQTCATWSSILQQDQKSPIGGGA
jgi:hypothetical protein